MSDTSAREREKHLDELMRIRYAVKDLQARLRNLALIGPWGSDVEHYAQELVVDGGAVVVALGYTDRLMALRPDDNDARSEAVVLWQLAVERKNLKRVAARLRKLNRPGLTSFSIAVDQWVRLKLLREIFADVLEQQKRTEQERLAPAEPSPVPAAQPVGADGTNGKAEKIGVGHRKLLKALGRNKKKAAPLATKAELEYNYARRLLGELTRWGYLTNDTEYGYRRTKKPLPK